MFGFGKKKSVDKLEELKKQLLELKEKEKALDSKAKQKKEKVLAKSSENISVDDIKETKKLEEKKEVVVEKPPISELNDEPPMIVKERKPREGVVLEMGAGMSLNIPIKERMDIKEFIKISERVKALAALNFEDTN